MEKFRVTLTHIVELIVDAENEQDVMDWAQVTSPNEAIDKIKEHDIYGEWNQFYHEYVERECQDLPAAVVIE